MSSTTKTNAKLEILSTFPQCQKLLLYAYHPNWQFGLTSKNVNKLANKLLDSDLAQEFDNVFDLLDAMKDDRVTGHAAIASCLKFAKKLGPFEYILYLILDKNLEIRCNVDTINKVFVNLIPIFDVPLAVKYEPDLLASADFDTTAWYCSRKRDGVRLVTCIGSKSDDITFYSREGKKFTSLNNLREAIVPLGLTNVVLDGEMCVLDSDGNENFKKAVSEIKRKTHQVLHPRYLLFDMVSMDDFKLGYSKVVFSQRVQTMRDLIKTADVRIAIMDQHRVKSHDHLQTMIDESTDKQWEGLILRLDCPFEAKRSKSMLKVKQFYDEEFVVHSIVPSEFRVVEDGKEVKKTMLGSVVILLNGQHQVNVGTGFSLEERETFYHNPDKIVGKTITVRYTEESQNEDGKPSLRFPAFKGIRSFM